MIHCEFLWMSFYFLSPYLFHSLQKGRGKKVIRRMASDGIKAEVDWVALRFWAILAKTSSSSNELSLYLLFKARPIKLPLRSTIRDQILPMSHSYHTHESRIKIDQSRLVRFGHIHFLASNRTATGNGTEDDTRPRTSNDIQIRLEIGWTWLWSCLCCIHRLHSIPSTIHCNALITSSSISSTNHST